ncbi:phenylalanine--tRNA ligase subunit beta [uncultured Desulfovibrio sp.]|uniref:phenylalanine--tRNA ligase subunit beta n=1 Tax=uncultured Desulfovibrio sp. TaxID=167968 RepID=UPI0026369B8E|nr:phenylalanine--tRNA ligase subunit beta [uncultured Desulfovibrio sp.]
MLLSLSWLREFVPYEGTAQELGDRLTMLGLELEEIVRPYDGIASIVVGHVVECVDHPESDHLHICKVDAGQGELLDIVCGAPNVAAGQKVPVALVGTTMPGGLVIKKAKLRGAPSCGMICSERELGLTEDHSGIMVLPETAVPGALLVDTLELDREVLDISITPNRADCLSVIGLARETAQAFGLPFRIPERECVEDGPAVELPPIDIRDPDLCWLYTGRVITGSKIAPSPMRIRHRLHAVGVRPISNIVDVTNYILMECGQPLHSFDLDKLQGGRIIVSRAEEGEKFVTLDGQERTLDARDLCIRDAGRAVGLAGVMGGLNTEIDENSRNVFLESAVFRPGTIRKTSRRLGLSSEASYRFERGIDQQRTRWALDRACAMMAELSGGKVCPGVAVAEPRPFAPVLMDFRPARANALLGVELSEDFCERVLSGLGCEIRRKGESWQVAQPSWRPDLTREADLIEEVGRVHGLDTIAPVLPPIARDLARAGEPESRFAFWSRIKRWGAGLGLNEAINYSFVGHKDLDHLGLPQEGRIAIMNPLSAEQDALRTWLAPGLLNSLRNNLAQGAAGLRLFELAHVFHARPLEDAHDTGATETGKIGILLYGARYDSAWPQPEGDMDYTDLKGVVEHLLSFLHLSAPRYRQMEGHPFLLPCVELMLPDGEGQVRAGVLGRVRPDMADAFHARKAIWLAELDLEVLRRLHDAARVRFRPLPVYPPVRRDITVMAAPQVQVAQIMEHVRGLRLPLLEDIVLQDCFEPAGSDERNLTFRLTFRHAERTLKDAEVDKEREKVAQSLVKHLGVRV